MEVDSVLVELAEAVEACAAEVVDFEGGGFDGKLVDLFNGVKAVRVYWGAGTDGGELLDDLADATTEAAVGAGIVVTVAEDFDGKLVTVARGRTLAPETVPEAERPGLDELLLVPGIGTAPAVTAAKPDDPFPIDGTAVTFDPMEMERACLSGARGVT